MITLSLQNNCVCVQTHTHALSLSLLVSACPIPVVSQCYLSLTCHGCQVLMDGKQIGRRERQEQQDINNASFCILPLLCLSLDTAAAGASDGGRLTRGKL